MSGYSSKAEATDVIKRTLTNLYGDYRDFYVSRMVSELVSGGGYYGYAIEISAEKFVASADRHRRKSAAPTA